MAKTDKTWYAIYVRSRCEKMVKKLLDDNGFESYLPLVGRVRQWSDRKKKVEEPLFKSYLFVHINYEKEAWKLREAGVYIVKFICFEGKPVVVPDNQISAIQRYTNYFDEKEEEFLKNSIELKKGQKVRITSGPMMGITGTLTEINDNKRILIEIDAIGATIPVSIARTHVEPLIADEHQS